MRNDFLKKMETFLKNQRRRKLARGVAAGLAAAMALMTTNAMILPAISLEKAEAEGEAGIYMATDSNAKASSSNTIVIADWPDMKATASNAMKARERIYRDDEIEIIATYSNAAMIPDEAEFVVEKLEPGEFPEETEKMSGEEYARLRAGDEADSEKKSTLEEVEAFIKSLLKAEREDAEAGTEESTEAESLESIRLNIEETTAAEAEGAEMAAVEAENAETIGEEAEIAKTEKDDAKDTELPSLRYKIGFYLNGIEIEPQDTVSLHVRFFTEDFTQADGVRAVHYLENHEDAETEIFEPKTEIDEDGAVRTVFDMDSFSVMEFMALARASEVTVTYDADGAFERAGDQYIYPSTEQSWRDDVFVTGLDGGSLETASGSYEVRDISADTRVAKAKYGDQGEILFTYAFEGWERSDTGELVKPGEVIELSEDIELTAVWCLHFSHSESNCNTASGDMDLASVAFYVAIVENVTGTGYASFFTDCLYTTRVLQGKEWANDNSASAIYGSDYPSDAQYEEYDKTLREQAESGITTTTAKGTYTVQLANFPSDSEIFNRISTWGERKSGAVIEVGDKQYQPEEITADNFEIRWYVLKTSTNNTWHVDGRLIPRKAKLTVAKTFVGDGDAVAQITGESSSYGITVSANADSNGPYNLNLRPYDPDSNPYGWKEKNGNTYTWVLEGLLPLTEYTVREQNYTVNGYTTTANYQISQSRDSSADTNGWTAYPTRGGIQLQCYSYQDSVPYTAYQTAALRNVYTKPFILSVIKQDGTTYHGLAEVTFDLKLVKDGTEYTAVVTSDDDGNIAIDFGNFNGVDLGAGTYSFELAERETEGYSSVVTATGTVNVDSTGKVTVEKIETAVSGDNTTAYVDSANQSLIYVVNHSETTSVTVSKIWTDGTNKPVTMQLLRNGAAVTDSVGVLDDGSGWTYTWNDLPLYVDGKKAEYGVRETWIGTPGESGSASYTEGDDTDGYRDYIVTQTQETDANGNTVITVRNTRDQGQVQFAKINEAGERLSGAVFTVYSDKDCMISVGTFESNESGIVTISGLVNGVYYVKETTAPSGYVPSEEIYTLEMKSRNSSLTDKTGTVSEIENKALEVTLSIWKITKTDGKAVGLEGARFMLFDAANYAKHQSKDTAAAIAEWASTADAYTLASGLAPGEYYLVETKAPDGYRMLNGPVKITIDGAGDVTAEAQGSSDGIVDVTNEGAGYTVSVENLAGQALPNTGGEGRDRYRHSGMFFMAAAVVCGYMLKRRRERRAV